MDVFDVSQNIWFKWFFWFLKGFGWFEGFCRPLIGLFAPKKHQFLDLQTTKTILVVLVVVPILGANGRKFPQTANGKEQENARKKKVKTPAKRPQNWRLKTQHIWLQNKKIPGTAKYKHDHKMLLLTLFNVFIFSSFSFSFFLNFPLCIHGLFNREIPDHVFEPLKPIIQGPPMGWVWLNDSMVSNLESSQCFSFFWNIIDSKQLIC